MFLSERTVWPYRYRRGASALVVSIPHAGTFVPWSAGASLAEAAAARPDTDWHLPRLYDFLEALDATVIEANLSRYVIDLNRPPDGSNLYPGEDTPRLCPVETFAGAALYRSATPDGAEIARRLEAVWQPYHRRLQREIERVRSAHGVAVLWDAHSIASRMPRLFEGRLADFNLGTAKGASCHPALEKALAAALGRRAGYTCAVNGRFIGGYITRRYGRPAAGVHAAQLEIAEATYMDERAPWSFREERAARIRPILREQLEIALEWARGAGRP
ncbi:MAG TPA: N-formylglutamate deformylase [Usitatibacter sp.]|nr:N-formylglutamate deformylase [Usitatibacter sp.]